MYVLLTHTIYHVYIQKDYYYSLGDFVYDKAGKPLKVCPPL